MFPAIWAEAWIAGQNVLLHANRNFVPYGWVLTDRNTLLSVDVRSAQTLKDVVFYVMFNGQRIDSLPTNVRRWSSSYRGDDGFEKTVNFVLPPVPISRTKVVNVTDCAVYADISGLSGGDIGRPASNTSLLANYAMQFKQPPAARVQGLCRSGTRGDFAAARQCVERHRHPGRRFRRHVSHPAAGHQCDRWPSRLVHM